MRVVVLGGNFAGVTAAIETKMKLNKIGKDHEVTVISPSDRFLYVPSLIWVPFGRRKLDQISFPVAPILRKKKVQFIHDKAIKVDPKANTVDTAANGTISYDYLIVATGSSTKFDVVENLGKYTQCIVSPPKATAANEAFQDLLKNPGPVVVGATQGASCMGAAYEYLFNLDKELRRHKIRDKVELTWITPEPFLGHFGIEGMFGGQTMLEAFMKLFKINFICNASIQEVREHEIVLKDGQVLPFKMSMIMPPFEGADVIKNSEGLGDAKGFIPCKDNYQHQQFDNIYAAGLAVQVVAPFSGTPVPFGVPKTGYPTDTQGKIVAHNIAAMVEGGQKKPKELPFGKIPAICIMDAGGKEVYLLSNHMFKPRLFEILLPNVFGHPGKLLLEQYMLFKNRMGLVWLP